MSLFYPIALYVLLIRVISFIVSFSSQHLLKMDDQSPLVFEATVNNRLFGFPDVLDKNIDNIIVNECDVTLNKPSDK